MNKDKPEAEKPETQTVILLNFGDAPRVMHNAKSKAVNVEIGAALRIELTKSTIERLTARDKTLIILPEDIADKATGPYMRRVLDALRDFNSLTYERALQICNITLGEGSFDNARPTKTEMRLALARRAKDAAHYIIAGANETADELLGEGRELAALKPAKDGPGLVAGDVVQGDPEEGSDADVSFYQRPPGYVEPDADDADGKQSNDAGNAEGDGGQERNDAPAGSDEADAGDGSAGENGGEAGSRAPRPVTGSPASPEKPPRPVTGE